MSNNENMIVGKIGKVLIELLPIILVPDALGLKVSCVCFRQLRALWLDRR